jgi:DNA-binding NtrC family response regulator
VARAIYQHSRRADKPFLVINCVAIPENLLESELFGYEKGAFTGATYRKVGKIEQAHKGTVFLDEIGDMPFSIQAKILRLLQEKSIERLGGRESIPVDVRILAATNRDLESALEKGRFREDLYYRLKVVTIPLPPLRDRQSDISLLTEYFLARFVAELGMENPGITPEAMETMNSYHWPGNIRELSNTIQKALIFNRGTPLRPEDITQAISAQRPDKNIRQDTEQVIRRWAREAISSGEQKDLYDSCMDYFAGVLISEALKITADNRTRAAELLGLSRPTLHAKIEKYGIRLETSVKNG